MSTASETKLEYNGVHHMAVVCKDMANHAEGVKADGNSLLH